MLQNGKRLNTLIVGSGGREDALRNAFEDSEVVSNVLCTPGNGGMPPWNCRDIKETNIDGILNLVEKEKINFVAVGPEAPLAAGLVDELTKIGVRAFGPTMRASELEWSKVFTKQRCHEWGIRTARFATTDVFDEAHERIVYDGFRVVKANGLCAGKGVTVSETADEAVEAARQLLVEKTKGLAGQCVVLEEKLEGRECSVMAFCDGINAVLLPASRDKKRAWDGPLAPNTGGMGAYSPLPDVDDSLLEEIKSTIILPTLSGMMERGFPFQGLLYAGLMLTKDGPSLVEYNVRFGDPELQAVLPRIQSDIVQYMHATTSLGGLKDLPPLEVSDDAAVCTVMTSKGYPGAYKTGFVIENQFEAKHVARVYHAGTRWNVKGELETSGGRVLNCVGVGGTHEEAQQKSLQAAEIIQFEGKTYRNDIANDV